MEEAVGKVGDALLAAGTIDALGEQLVAGADADGDVLVILRHDPHRLGGHRPNGARCPASGRSRTPRRA